MTRFTPILALLATLMPQPGNAHPHVFIEAGVEIIFDAQGQLTHLRVTWAYDAFYSLLLVSDMGLDPDRDGALTPAEEGELAGFDAKWSADYNGDLVARLDGQQLKLSGPLQPTAQVIDGQIVSTHLREVTGTPLPGRDALSVKIFDETYYTSYDVTRGVTLTGGPGCTITRHDPDIDQELSRMQAMLLSIDADADLEEMDIPLIGEAFASEIKVTCGTS